MSIDISGGSATALTVGFFLANSDAKTADKISGTYTDLIDVISIGVTETANDGSPTDAYASLLSTSLDFSLGNLTISYSYDVTRDFFIAHAGTTITFDIAAAEFNPITASFDGVSHHTITIGLQAFDPLTIFNDYLAITRTILPFDQAITEAKAIDAITTTEAQFVSNLLAQVANTTIPAVAVEASMYNAVGTSDEITKLATLFLPAQVQNATQNHLNPQVYACEAVGLAFAFGDENGGTAFGTKFGPTAPGMPATPAGDAFFAATAAQVIFASDANANTPGAIQQFVSNWEAFYTSHGVPGISHATADQIVLAARGAAWGDAVGVALANHLGPLPGQVINFLEDAAQGNAKTGASLSSQPLANPLEGEDTGAGAAPGLQLVGVAAHADHMLV
jgi:hypothetical protein